MGVAYAAKAGNKHPVVAITPFFSNYVPKTSIYEPV